MNNFKKTTKLFFATIIYMALTNVCFAQKPLYELQKDFLNLRFGMFIHYSIQTYLNVEHAPPHQDLKVFNPTNLDCEQWADAAISANMTYGVLTTKHHDGFCLWDSKFTEYDVANSSYKGDVIQEFSEAFRNKGLKVGLYYSVRDKQHEIKENTVTPEKIEFIKNQLTELLTNYGEIECIIFDGWGNSWHNSPTFEDIPYAEIYWHIKSIQPNCLVITHRQNPSVTEIIEFEQNAGEKIESNNALPAQSGACIQSRWFWDCKFPKKKLKSVDWVTNECLIPFNKIYCNFLLNCAPNSDGRMDDNLIKRLKQIGKAWTAPEPIKEVPEEWKNYPVPKKL